MPRKKEGIERMLDQRYAAKNDPEIERHQYREGADVPPPGTRSVPVDFTGPTAGYAPRRKRFELPLRREEEAEDHEPVDVHWRRPVGERLTEASRYMSDWDD